MSVAISIKNAVKRYGSNTVVHDLSVDIRNGELFTLLGPSGCGKTTLLRMIAGFSSIEGGTFAFDGNVINNIPAHKRNIGMVFQNYAIFPHLTVRQNVEYGLKIRKINKAERNRRVDEILEIVKITDYQNRLPENLSGGQQQRVALARAIVIHPSVLLMDEPLSNLDAKLRVEMRSAIREIQEKVGITTVYVTHDQEEALAISDRIAVMDAGVIQQVGAPEAIYTKPYNTFVSSFIGHSSRFKGSIKPDVFADESKGDSGSYILTMSPGCTVRLDNMKPDLGSRDVLVAIRPEEFILCKEIGNEADMQAAIKFTIKTKTFLGTYTQYELVYEGMEEPPVKYFQDIGQAEKIYDVGETVLLKPNRAKINLFTTQGDESLMKEAYYNG